MSNIIGNFVNCFFGFIGFFIVVSIIVRALHNYLVCERKVNAVIINKQCLERRVSQKHSASYTVKEYIVTFQTLNKKRYFNVSEFSFPSYKIGQKGILTYKGNNIINFHEA